MHHPSLFAAALLVMSCFTGCGGSASDPPAPAGAAPAADSVPAPPDAPAASGRPVADGPAKRVRGVVLDPEGKPLAGATVRLEGGAGPAVTTGADGAYSIAQPPAGEATVHASLDGSIDAYVSLWIWTDEERLVDIELYPRATERADFVEVYGQELTPGTGVVSVQFEDRRDSSLAVVGGRVEIGEGGGLAVGIRPFVYGPDDDLVPGNVVPKDASTQAVEFIDVPEAPLPLTVTPPAGLVCEAPRGVLARAGAYATVVVSCQPPTP